MPYGTFHFHQNVQLPTKRHLNVPPLHPPAQLDQTKNFYPFRDTTPHRLSPFPRPLNDYISQATDYCVWFRRPLLVHHWLRLIMTTTVPTAPTAAIAMISHSIILAMWVWTWMLRLCIFRRSCCDSVREKVEKGHASLLCEVCVLICAMNCDAGEQQLTLDFVLDLRRERV